jgi:PAS domain S-box-containing protein
MKKSRSRREGVLADPARLLDELQSSQNKYRKLIDDNLIGAAVSTLTGEVFEANDAFLKMIGYSREELDLGVARWDTVTSPEFMSVEKKQRIIARRTGRAVYEKEYIRRDGTRVPILLCYSLLDSKKAICFAIDLTEQKRVQQQLQAAVSARDDFLSIASHELKTPLTTLQLQLEMLRRSFWDEDQGFDRQKINRRLNGFQEQLNRLSVLVESLLDVTRIRGDQLELQRTKFDLHALAEEVIERIHSQPSNKGLKIRLLGEKRLFGVWDKTRLDQVLTNLLLNAIKYGDGSQIDVRLKSEKGTIQLHVKDRGIGIRDEDQLRVFDRFERAASHNYGGLGLGLYITRRLVERHGGKVWLKSEIKKGSTFFVQLPKVRAGKPGRNQSTKFEGKWRRQSRRLPSRPTRN